MTRETIPFTTEAAWLAARAQDLTSTEVAALFGCSPYATAYELWHRKKGNLAVEPLSNDRVRWGQRLQDSIAQGVAEDQGWAVTKATEYIRLPELRAGASFDYWIGTDGVLEVKNVDALRFRDGWIIDGDNVEAPPHIELQLQHQLWVAGLKYGYIAALIGGNRVALIRREPDAHIIGSIRARVAAFWASIEANQPPPPQFPADAETVARLHGYAEPGRVMDANGNQLISGLAVRYKELSEAMKAAEDERKSIKAQLLMQVGEAEKILGDGFTISAGVQGPVRVEAHDRAGFRRFAVSFKKAKP